METVTEVTESGVTKEVERKVFPGYVLIKMVMTDDTWHLVRNVRGVTGFVGEANKPIPLTEDEVAAMGVEKHEIVVLLPGGRHRQDHGRPAGQLHRHRGGDRAREEQGPRGGLHVRPRDPRGAGAGPGGGSALRRSSLCAAGRSMPLRHKWERRCPSRQERSGMTGRYHIYDLGGAYPWHRKLLVM